MSETQLADFIETHRETIIAEWESFAGTLVPAAEGMAAAALRDHAEEILSAIVDDMRLQQSSREQEAKSKGQGKAQRMRSIGTIHAELRIGGGFKLGQLVAEYRALRASVLRLWAGDGTDNTGVTRFNEAVDEALTLAVESFTARTERFRDQSLGILGHDLRNPLSTIVTGATVLSRMETLDDKSSRIATRMLGSAKRMARMIDDLLDLTRIRTGDSIPVVRASMDLGPLCQQVAGELEGTPGAGAIECRLSGDLRGAWDHDRLAQTLSNLIRNAIQHGAPSGAITVTASADDDLVNVQIHNTGRPIPPAALATLFDPMVRHVDEPGAGGGLGLGLYIAEQNVLAHAGTLVVTSSEGEGTTFTVRLGRHASTPPKPSRGTVDSVIA